MSDKIEQTNRTKLKRIPKRGNFDRETINQILDEAFVCHVGFTIDNHPFVLPTAYARDGDRLLIHGSSASRMMRNLSNGIEVCVTVTLIDGLVLARSAFHHSMNYRSVVIFGTAELVENEAEKYEALRHFTEHIVPQRWDEIRPPNAKELKATTVLSLPIEEASAKVRTGNPIDDEADYELNVWAGVIPIQLKTGRAFDDGKVKENVSIPSSVLNYKRSENFTTVNKARDLKDFQQTIEFLEETPKLLSLTVKDLPTEALKRKISKTEFSIHEHIWHLHDIEQMGYAVRIEKLLGETQPVLQDIDGAKLAAERRYHNLDFTEGLNKFLRARRENIARLKELSPEQLNLAGKFGDETEITLARLVEMMREHDVQHRSELRDLILILNN